MGHGTKMLEKHCPELILEKIKISLMWSEILCVYLIFSVAKKIMFVVKLKLQVHQKVLFYHHQQVSLFLFTKSEEKIRVNRKMRFF